MSATTWLTIAQSSLLSRWLSTPEYATFKQAMLVYSFGAGLMTLGIPRSLIYFIPKDRANAKTIVLSAWTILCTIGLLFCLFCVLGGPLLIAKAFNNASLEQYFPWIAAFGLASLLGSMLPSFLLSIERTDLVASAAIVSRLTVFLALTAAITIRSSGFDAFRAATIATALVGALSVVAIWYLAEGPFKSPNWANCSKILRYSVPLGLAGIVEGLALRTDKLIVATLCDARQFAIFVNGATEIPLVSIVAGSATAVVLPEIVNRFEKGDVKTAFFLWQSMAKKTAIILFPVTGALAWFAPEIITTLFSEHYVESTFPFRCYLTLIPPRVVVFAAIFQAAGRSDILLFRSVIVLISNFAISYGLVALYGMNGAAIGTILVFWVFTIPYCLWRAADVLSVRTRELLPYRWLFATATSVAFAVATVHFLVPRNTTYSAPQLLTALSVYAVGLIPFLAVTRRELLATAGAICKSRNR